MYTENDRSKQLTSVLYTENDRSKQLTSVSECTQRMTFWHTRKQLTSVLYFCHSLNVHSDTLVNSCLLLTSVSVYILCTQRMTEVNGCLLLSFSVCQNVWHTRQNCLLLSLNNWRVCTFWFTSVHSLCTFWHTRQLFTSVECLWMYILTHSSVVYFCRVSLNVHSEHTRRLFTSVECVCVECTHSNDSCLLLSSVSECTFWHTRQLFTSVECLWMYILAHSSVVYFCRVSLNVHSEHTRQLFTSVECLWMYILAHSSVVYFCRVSLNVHSDTLVSCLLLSSVSECTFWHTRQLFTSVECLRMYILTHSSVVYFCRVSLNVHSDTLVGCLLLSSVSECTFWAHSSVVYFCRFSVYILTHSSVVYFCRVSLNVHSDTLVGCLLLSSVSECTFRHTRRLFTSVECLWMYIPTHSSVVYFCRVSLNVHSDTLVGCLLLSSVSECTFRHTRRLFTSVECLWMYIPTHSSVVYFCRVSPNVHSDTLVGCLLLSSVSECTFWHTRQLFTSVECLRMYILSTLVSCLLLSSVSECTFRHTRRLFTSVECLWMYIPTHSSVVYFCRVSLNVHSDTLVGCLLLSVSLNVHSDTLVSCLLLSSVSECTFRHTRQLFTSVECLWMYIPTHSSVVYFCRVSLNVHSDTLVSCLLLSSVSECTFWHTRQLFTSVECLWMYILTHSSVVYFCRVSLNVHSDTLVSCLLLSSVSECTFRHTRQLFTSVECLWMYIQTHSLVVYFCRVSPNVHSDTLVSCLLLSSVSECTFWHTRQLFTSVECLWMYILTHSSVVYFCRVSLNVHSDTLVSCLLLSSVSECTFWHTRQLFTSVILWMYILTHSSVVYFCRVSLNVHSDTLVSCLLLSSVSECTFWHTRQLFTSVECLWMYILTHSSVVYFCQCLWMYIPSTLVSCLLLSSVSECTFWHTRQLFSSVECLWMYILTHSSVVYFCQCLWMYILTHSSVVYFCRVSLNVHSDTLVSCLLLSILCVTFWHTRQLFSSVILCIHSDTLVSCLFLSFSVYILTHSSVV